MNNVEEKKLGLQRCCTISFRNNAFIRASQNRMPGTLFHKLNQQLQHQFQRQQIYCKYSSKLLSDRYGSLINHGIALVRRTLAYFTNHCIFFYKNIDIVVVQRNCLVRRGSKQGHFVTIDKIINNSPKTLKRRFLTRYVL